MSKEAIGAKEQRDEQNSAPEQKLQEKYMELQMLNAHMQQFQQKAQAIEQQCGELDQAQQALEAISETKESESFVTVTPGVLARGKIEDTEHVLVNVGSGVLVEKPLKETVKDIAAQVSELRQIQQEVQSQRDQLTVKATAAEQELQELVR